MDFKDVDYFITGLRNKSDDAKLRAAREFKNYVVNELKDKSREEMTRFIDKLLHEFTRLATGANVDMNDKKAVLIALASVADKDFIFSHNTFVRLSLITQDIPVSTEIQVSALQARLLALLNLISTADKVDAQIKEACSLVVDDSKPESQRLFAAFIFKETAFFSSTVFYQHASRVINSLLFGIRDKQAGVREVCATALAGAFAVTSAREGIGRRRQKAGGETGGGASLANVKHLAGLPQYHKGQSPQPANYARASNEMEVAKETAADGADGCHEIYGTCIEEMLRGADEPNLSSHIDNRKLPQDAWNHGSLLLLIELLKLSNDEMEINRLELEHMMGLPMDQFSNSSLPAAILAARNACRMDWPCSDTEEHILQHRAKIHVSPSCRKFLQNKLDAAWRVLTQNLESKQLYVIQLVMHAIPRLIALDLGQLYIKEYNQCIEFLNRCIKKDREKPLALITLGLIAHSSPAHFEQGGHLQRTLACIKQNIPSKEVAAKKRQPLVDIAVYMLIGLLATGCRQRVHDCIKWIIEPIVEAGLSFPLIYSLKMVSCFVTELTDDIHATLLKSLRKTLMLGQRHSPGKPQPSDTDLQLAAGLLSPLVTTTLSADQIEARNKILALRTLVEFDFDKRNLSMFVRFISSKLISFIICPFKEVRLEAVKTCAQLLTPLLGNDDEISCSDRNTLTAVADVLEKLLIVSTSDPEAEVRLCVFQSFDERFDPYLAQECHLSPLFMALHDDNFEIRKLVIRCLGRLSAINPSCLKPSLRNILLQTLTELEHSRSSRDKEQAATLLAELIDTAPGFIQQHSEQLLLVLLPRMQSIINAAKSQSEDLGGTMSLRALSMAQVSSSRVTDSTSQSWEASPSSVQSKVCVEPTAVQLAVVQAVKNLAVVCGSKLRRHLDDLVPALIYMMRDSSSLEKRSVAVSTLTKLITHTGYVVEPYKRHPRLLGLLLTMLRNEEVGSIRREVIKLLGTIGALDPFKLKMFSAEVDSAGDTGLVVSMHEVVEKREVDMTQAELLVNISWNSLEEFYVACALQSLIQLLRDPTFRSYNDKICSAIILIFKTLGSKSVQYLRQVLPEYFRCIIEAQDIRHQETLIGQLCFITDIVKLHLKQFMPQIVEILLHVWGKTSSLTHICIKLLHRLNAGLAAEVKPFLSPLIPVFQQTLCEAAEQSVKAILELLPEFGHSLEEYVHIVLGSIIKIIARDDGPLRIESKKCALDCLTRLAERLDLSDFAGRIVQPVCRLLDCHDPSSDPVPASGSATTTTTLTITTEQLLELVPYAFDLFTTLLVRMRRRFMVLIPLVQRAQESIKAVCAPGGLHFARYNTALNKVLKVSYICYHDDEFQNYESFATRRRLEQSLATGNAYPSLEEAPRAAHEVNSLNLTRAWQSTKMVSGEDWSQWLRHLAAALVRESPSAAIRSCCNIGGCAPALSRALLNAAFVSCWPELTDGQQDELIGTLESVLRDCPSTEVSQAVLNLEEFMTHCDRMKLPVSTAALARRALKNRVYAKALYYKEQEFLEETGKKGLPPPELLFELLSIYDRLQLGEAASGVVIYATRLYRDKITNEERWHERLQDWTRALNLYERKIEETETRRNQGNDLVLGRMRCLQALGSWQTLKVVGAEKIDTVEEADRTKMAPMLAHAAWAIGDFNSMSKYVEYVPAAGTFEGPFLRAVIAIHHEDFHLANDCIQRARDELDTCLTAMAGESYIRAYGDLVEAQKLAELEEVIQYKLVRESQETIKQAWNDRLKGCQQVIDDWRHLLQIRSLVLHPSRDMGTWLKFAGLARRSNRLEMARSIMERLFGGDLDKLKREDIISCSFPEIIFSWVKYQWSIGHTGAAIDNLKVLVENKLPEDLAASHHFQGSSQAHQLKQRRLLLAKCSLRLGDWYTEQQAKEPETGPPEAQRKIVEAYKTATEEAPSLVRPWQAWAMANYGSICMSKARIVEVTRQMTLVAKKWTQLQPREAGGPGEQRRPSGGQTAAPGHQNGSGGGTAGALPLPNEVLRMSQPQLRFSLLQSHHRRGGSLVSFPSATPHVPAANVTFGQAMGVKTPAIQAPTQGQGDLAEELPEDAARLAHRYLQLERQRRGLLADREAHSHPAVRGFVNAISLSANANLQDSLRLVILLFQFGHLPRIREVIRDGLAKIKVDNWLLVIQQLLARIDTQKEHVSSIIVGLLITVGERHPQAMVSPLVLAFKSGGSDRRRYNANKILHSMETHSAQLVAEAFLLNEELIRLAISWMEMWTECLEDASRLFYEEKNVVAMFKILYPLHLLMEREIETIHEAAFYNEYYTELVNAKNLCIRYESSNYKTDLTQAWEIYSNLYRKWSKQISNFSTLELSVASPRLNDYTGWILAVPGSYDPNRPVVKVASIKNCLNMMTSKQHPRKLTIIGSDGHNYMFLLKGHEDIRQDERAMQFFGLINTLLVSNPLTLRRNLSIQRMSVIPLSTNTGLIGWVPNSDTLNAVIRDYREKMSMLLNKEHKEMLKIAPDFEKLNIIQKTEVFEQGIRESDGRDLAHILWLKSHNSESWFERRTNFVRSLAVMSMVGHVLGLGDRHPSNIMLCRDSGKVIHIDFGDCFEVATMREKYPEKVPFRLTRMLIGAMEVTGIDGLFRQTCVQIVQIMRRNRESLLAVLEAFIHDPLLQWVLHDSARRGEAGPMAEGESDAASSQAGPANQLRACLGLPLLPRAAPAPQPRPPRPPTSSVSLPLPILADNVRIFTDPAYPDSRTLRNPLSVNQWRHHLCNGPWLGCYNTALKARKRAPDGSIVVERAGLENLIFSARAPTSDRGGAEDPEDEWAGANLRAMDVMTHIQNKLEGKEAAGSLSPDEHVDLLIRQANSNYNLCQMYFGWCAFW